MQHFERRAGLLPGAGPCRFNIGAIVGGVTSVISGISGGGSDDPVIPCPSDTWRSQANILSALNAAPASVTPELGNHINSRRGKTIVTNVNDRGSVAYWASFYSSGGADCKCGEFCVKIRPKVDAILNQYSAGPGSGSTTPGVPISQPPQGDSLTDKVDDALARINDFISGTRGAVAGAEQGARDAVAAERIQAGVAGFPVGLAVLGAVAIAALFIFARRR